MRDGAALQPEQKSLRSTSSTRRPLQRQFAEDADAVDAAANDDDVERAVAADQVEASSLCSGMACLFTAAVAAIA